jgi:SAM-dependent methyltransferase
MSQRLHQGGFDVVAADLYPEVFEPTFTRCVKVDANGSWPFAAAEFDAITCVEGIEHLENPWHVAREFRRVLKPGGFVVVTTPNVMGSESRLFFFLTGNHVYFTEELADSWGHITPLGYPYLSLALRAANLKVEDVSTNRSMPEAGMLRIVQRLALRVFRLGLRSLNDKARRLEENSTLAIPQLQAGDILVIAARKMDEAGRSSR